MRSQRVAIGGGLLALSGITIYGGVTGRLAPMIGAVFAPSTLTTPQGSKHKGITGWLNDRIEQGLNWAVPGLGSATHVLDPIANPFFGS